MADTASTRSQEQVKPVRKNVEHSLAERRIVTVKHGGLGMMPRSCSGVWIGKGKVTERVDRKGDRD